METRAVSSENSASTPDHIERTEHFTERGRCTLLLVPGNWVVVTFELLTEMIIQTAGCLLDVGPRSFVHINSGFLKILVAE